MEVDLSGIQKGAGDGDGGVRHGDALLAFADAVILGPDTALTESRSRLLNLLGTEGLVDAAATVASFNSVVRLADSTGIPIEAHKQEIAAGLEQSFGPREAWYGR